MDPSVELRSLKEMYVQTLAKLKEYALSTDRMVNIPISSVGFIQGKLINTDQISVCISSQFNITTDVAGSEELIRKKIEGNQ